MTTSPTVFRLASRLEGVGFSDIVKIRNKVMEFVLRARPSISLKAASLS